MRPIKFRAWDKVNKRMYHHFDMPDNFLMTLDCVVINTDAPDGFGLGLGKAVDSFELMQYTSLVDKAGNEIYEGDIVKATTEGDRVFTSDSYCFLVSFVNNGWYLRTNAGLVNAFENRFASLEVIGNVYEHPNLLNT